MNNSTINFNQIIDVSLANRYIDERLAIGSALFILFVIHYFSYAAYHIMQYGNISELKQVEKNIFLFGIAVLLSCNILQSGIYQAVFCYFSLIGMILLHLTVFDKDGKYRKIKKYFWLWFYFALFMWFFGIIIDYYDFYAVLKA